MAAPRRIGILTGGGDVPGLNSVIKSVVYRATELGYEVVGIRRGWEGLTHQRRGPELDPEYVRILDRINTRTIDRTGGTILHCSRTNPRKMRAAALPSWLDPKTVADKQTSEGVYDLTDHVLDTIEHLGLTPPRHDRRRRHALVLVGAATSAACRWSRSPRRWTTTSTGPSTASASRPRSRGRRRSSTASGRRSAATSGSACSASSGATPGFTALYTAYVTSTRCVIPEFPYDLDALAEILKEDHRNNPSRYAMVITAEGAIWQGAQIADVGEADAFGHRHKVNVGEVLATRAQGPDRDRGRRRRS